MQQAGGDYRFVQPPRGKDFRGGKNVIEIRLPAFPFLAGMGFFGKAKSAGDEAIGMISDKFFYRHLSNVKWKKRKVK
jgi:hypothetical protein